MLGAALVLALAIAGLAFVKWSPYFAKVFVAAAHHSIGASIVSGKAVAAPAPSWATAWTYAKAYYLAVWEALAFALVLGAAFQVFVPRAWVYRTLGGAGLRPTAAAATLSLAGMM